MLATNCLEFPFPGRARLVNNAIVEHFLVDLKLMEHLAALKCYLLMEDGEFARALSSQLFHQVQFTLLFFLSPAECLLLSVVQLASSCRQTKATDCFSSSLEGSPISWLGPMTGTQNLVV